MAKMSQKDLNFFRDLLNEKKEKLLQELGYFEDNAMRAGSDGSGDLAGVSYHMADQGTELADTEQAFRLASREGKFLNHLEEALIKINNGTYGICVSCKELIPRARLEAVPTAKMCIACKTEKENKK